MLSPLSTALISNSTIRSQSSAPHMAVRYGLWRPSLSWGHHGDGRLCPRLAWGHLSGQPLVVSVIGSISNHGSLRDGRLLMA